MLIDDLSLITYKSLTKHAALGLQSLAADVKTLLNVNAGDEHAILNSMKLT